MDIEATPGLFGIKHSNRDFSQKEAWGKNCFNSSFPAALSAYLYGQNLDNIYLKLDDNLQIVHSTITTLNLYSIEPTSDDLFYAFESQFTPYQQYVIGNLPGVDLVTQSRDRGVCLQPLEIKLTALPDNTTCDLKEEDYGCELVIRPDTIVYLACSIIDRFKHDLARLKAILAPYDISISDWSEPNVIIPYIAQMVEALDAIALSSIEHQTPLLMQPVWKTVGKSSKLADNCLDIFVWSNLAFTRLFIDLAKAEMTADRKFKNIVRHTRILIWLFKMINDFANRNVFDRRKIIDNLSYNTKNDKAFAVSGKVTQKYMKSESLTKPRIHQSAIKNIILGGGQNLLSPERRFDAIVYSYCQGSRDTTNNTI